MATFILTWKPAQWAWDDLAQASQQTAEGGVYDHLWSTGNTRKIICGDRVFLLKQGEEPRGVVAAGRVISESVYDALHFNSDQAEKGKTAPRVDVRFERILNPLVNAPLAVETITVGPLARVTWHMRKGGVGLAQDGARQLEDLWARHLEGIDGPYRLSPDEADGAAGAPAPQDGDGRGHTWRQIRARRGQRAFRDALRQRHGDRCMISGCTLMDIVEAAHLRPYRREEDNVPTNGLLLRADLHTLFDLYWIGVEPRTLTVRVRNEACLAGYGQFDGVTLQCGADRPGDAELEGRWRDFQRRQTQPTSLQSAS